jgi:hypothetical protein
MSFLLNHLLRLPVQSNSSFFVTRCRFLPGRLRNILADLFLGWVDGLWFVPLLSQFIQLLNVVLVTPFGSYFFVQVVALGNFRFAF